MTKFAETSYDADYESDEDEVRVFSDWNVDYSRVAKTDRQANLLQFDSDFYEESTKDDASDEDEEKHVRKPCVSMEVVNARYREMKRNTYKKLTIDAEKINEESSFNKMIENAKRLARQEVQNLEKEYDRLFEVEDMRRFSNSLIVAPRSVNPNYRPFDFDTEVREIIENLVSENVTRSAFAISSREQLRSLLDIITNEFFGVRLLLGLPSGEIRTLNEKGIEELIKAIEGDITDEYYASAVSEAMSGSEYTLELAPKSIYEKKVGGYFNYLHRTEYDFSRFQLFSEFKIENYANNCLYDALKVQGLEEKKLNIIKAHVKDRKVAQCDLAIIAEQMGIQIWVYQYRKGSTKSDPVKKGKVGVVYRICLYESHYFVKEKLEIKIGDQRIKSSLDLFRFLFENKDEWLVKINESQRNSIGYVSGKLDSLEYDLEQIEKENAKYHDNLGFVSSKKIGYVVYADFECTSKHSDTYLQSCKDDKIDPGMHTHKAYQLGFRSAKGKKGESDFACYNANLNDSGKELVNLMLDEICRRNPSCMVEEYGNAKSKKKDNDCEMLLIYFHNLKYDSCFVLNNRLKMLDITEKDNSIYKLNFAYWHNIISTVDGKRAVKSCKFLFEIRDSYKHLTMPLAKFPSYFNLKSIKIGKEMFDLTRKEVIPYGIYTEETSFVFKNKMFSIDKACDELRIMGKGEKDISHFRQNIEDWGMGDGNGKFNIMRYSQRYNQVDVELLCAGMEKWKVMVEEFTRGKNSSGADLHQILTSASFAQKYFESNGAYDEVNKLNQAPRAFIQQSVYGGRVMTRRNEKIERFGAIQDFDGVSLYPSAMYRLKELGGVLKGTPKILKSNMLNYKFLSKKTDGYFVEVKILKMKDRDFPLIPKREECGTMTYQTDLLIGEVVTLGKIQLEDLIEFCNCKFEVIRGYYFDEGRDDTLCKVIENLFNKRLELKKVDSPLQAVIKLIMNSSYGKTIQKAADLKTVILENKDIVDPKTKEITNRFKTHVGFNYDYIKSFTQLSHTDKVLLKEYINVNDHYSMPHVGSEILAMSKRIMSEVMCLAEDNGIDIFYQDTDSMHIDEAQVPNLGLLFNAKYNRSLIGGNLGQFHCDFSSSLLEAEKEKGDKDFKLYSSCFIGLGKKSYLDVLVSPSGNVDYHARMKGIPLESMIKYCEGTKDRPAMNMLELYQRLLSGEEIVFDLTCGQTKPKFEIKSFFTCTKLDFSRKVRFI